MEAVLEDYARALRTIRQAAGAFSTISLPEPLRVRPSAEFLAELDELKKHAEALAGGIVVRRTGGAPRNLLKVAAATVARSLPHMHDRPAALTDGGPWPSLAALLYEMVTGIYGADLLDDCRVTAVEIPPLNKERARR
jgi:hypothetical protein